MKHLLENEFVTAHGIHSHPVADELVTTEVAFDLVDMRSPIELKPLGSGSISLKNTHGELSVVHYEDFIDQCKKPRSFYEGRKKCDYLLTHTDGSHTAMLVEITSALGNTDSLRAPIHHKKRGTVLYEGGKFEKCEEQLYQSLHDLKAVELISARLDAYNQRICMMAYVINSYTDKALLRKKPFLRYLHIEAKATADNGAALSSPKIESLGFEYRRIEHSHVFTM